MKYLFLNKFLLAYLISNFLYLITCNTIFLSLRSMFEQFLKDNFCFINKYALFLSFTKFKFFEISLLNFWFFFKFLPRYFEQSLFRAIRPFHLFGQFLIFFDASRSKQGNFLVALKRNFFFV